MSQCSCFITTRGATIQISTSAGEYQRRGMLPGVVRLIEPIEKYAAFVPVFDNKAHDGGNNYVARISSSFVLCSTIQFFKVLFQT
jgi:hypothetical protein